MLTKNVQRRKSLRKRYKSLDAARKSNGFIYPKDWAKIKSYESRKRRRNNASVPKKIPNTIELPKDIDFMENAESIVKITQKVDKYINKRTNAKFSIDHSDVKKVSLAGVLYMVGQVYKVLKANGHSNKKLNYSKKRGLNNNALTKTKFLLKEIGYWRQFGITKPYKLPPSVEKDFFLSIETDTKSNLPVVEKIRNFVNRNVDFLNSEEVIYRFDNAIGEAMGNAVEHAYDEGFNEKVKERGRWWVCGHYDKTDSSLVFVFYDYGIGIRKSIGIKMGEDADIALFDSLKDEVRSDADLIEMAINKDLSKYKKYNEEDRGQGFKKFMEFAKNSGHDCELMVVSGKGKYNYQYDSHNKVGKVGKHTLSDNIDGMMIKWTIQLTRKE